MLNMTKALTGALLCAALFLSAAQAADTGPTKAQIETAKAKTEGMPAAIAKDRDVRCPQQAAVSSDWEKACAALSKVLIMREQAQQSELELMLLAKSLKYPQSEQILKIVSGYNTFDNETVAMSNQLDLLFPKSRQSSER